jgi:hypothetical protein
MLNEFEVCSSDHILIIDGISLATALNQLEE